MTTTKPNGVANASSAPRSATTPTDEELRRLYRSVLDESGAEDDHPGEETWERWATGELAGPERARVNVHVASCGDCSRTARALLALRESARADADLAPRSRSRVRWGWLGLAAAALLGAVVSLSPRDVALAPGEGPTVRGPAETAPPIVPLRPARRVSTVAHFAWEPVPGGVGYGVKLSRADGQILWTSPWSDRPEQAFGEPLAAGSYLWEVSVRHADGRERTSLPILLEIVASDVPPDTGPSDVLDD